jgi:ribonuclease D
MVSPITALHELRRLLREVTALGVEFRISGTDVSITGADHLPADLRAALNVANASGLLLDYLDGDSGAGQPIALLAQLGVTSILVETRAAVRQIILASCQHPGPIGFDIETAAIPHYQRERPPVRLNRDGSLSVQQPAHNDPNNLSPHTACIATLQLYAGDDRCFIFRGEALELLLASHWLRSRHLVAHNATFDVAFLRHYAGSKPLAPHRRRGRIECSMQATGLLRGIGNRSLADAAGAFLGLEVSKDVRPSDWGAARLSRGQIAYAALDAVLVHRLWPLLDEQMAAKGRDGAYTLQRSAVLPVVDMELRGAMLDRNAHAAMVNKWSRELAGARHRYHELTGKPPPATPNQIRDWLADVMEPAQLNSWPRTESDQQLSVARKYLNRLAHIPTARPVLDILARERNCFLISAPASPH